MMENNIWDEGQLGAVVGVLGTVEQLNIDKSIMKEVKTYYQNLAVAFYDYKKAYDKVHHDWMLRVYKWIGMPDNIITLLNSIMRKWKQGWRCGNMKKKHQHMDYYNVWFPPS